MRTVHLASLGRNTTALGFGCAHLFRIGSGRERQRLIDAAYDAGIRHFDVARSYGLGRAERELRPLLRRHREDVVVATKFGIDPPPGGPLMRLQRPVRGVLKRSPWAQRVVRSRGSALARPVGNFDAQTARRSLHQSLSELGTDYVDLFFMHEPAPETGPFTDLVAELDTLRTEGLIRAWGVSGDPGQTLPLLPDLGDDAVLQVRDDLLTRGPGTVRERDTIVFGVLERALPEVLRARPDLEAELVAAALLQNAFATNVGGVVLFSTTQERRVAQAVAAACVESDPELLRTLRSTLGMAP